MTIESSFIPFPSEVVVPPAAYRAAASADLNVYLVVLFATIGADLGAIINYVISRTLGRMVIYKFAESKFGHLCLIDSQKVQTAEAFFVRHGAASTFFGRLVPAVRQLISIPAGLAKMKYWHFLLYAPIGAGAWNCILATLGWYLHTMVPEEQLHDKILEYGDYIKFAIIGIVGLVILWFAAKWIIKKIKK